MYGFEYSDWDPKKVQQVNNFKELLQLFNYLLLKFDGDADKTLNYMEYLQERGYINPDIDIDEFREQLENQEYIEQGDGGFDLTAKGVQGMRQSSLEFIFRDLNGGGPLGGHQTVYTGGGSTNDTTPNRRNFEFGDEIGQIDFNASILNSIKREGSTDGYLMEKDLEVFDTEFSTSCATVLLLDVSHSMILYGEDRFTPAKQVALALTELILTRYQKDTLDVILFGDEAVEVPIKELPFAKVGPFHTNTKAGLQHARRILERRKNPNKQIFMITDGKPTVIEIPGEGIYRNTFGIDDMILNRTLDEAVVCRRRGITITTFMVARDRFLEDFVHRLTELNQGRAYFSAPDEVGGFLLQDFIRNRKNRLR